MTAKIDQTQTGNVTVIVQRASPFKAVAAFCTAAIWIWPYLAWHLIIKPLYIATKFVGYWCVVLPARKIWEFTVRASKAIGRGVSRSARFVTSSAKTATATRR